MFALPKVEVSNFFYKKKLNVYHMTAHCSTNKQCYGALWTEASSGRTGNHMASAVMKILEQITTDLKALGEKHFSEPHHSVERFLRPSE